MAAQVPLAGLAEGRIISMNIYVRLTPPQTGEIGHTEPASAIGRGLIRESMLLLRTAAEKEGFEVFMEATARIY
jgi:hypothetical protein